MSVQLSLELDGTAALLVPDFGKGNILDEQAIGELSAAHAEALRLPEVRAILLEPAGSHFSFGASVVEHLPDRVRGMIPKLHALVRQLAASEAPVIAVVRGQCLGGGLEVALGCSRIVAAPGAKLGQPEVKLAVFAPAGSALLPRRVGDGLATRLLLTGEPLDAQAALAAGLVDEVAEDPRAAALAFAKLLCEVPASAVRRAHRAARAGALAALDVELARLEALYLGEVAGDPVAIEGLTAFVERRAPSWARRSG